MRETQENNTITYKDFKMCGGNVPDGTIITEVKPCELFTTQPWVSSVKVEHVLAKKDDDSSRLETQGYVFKMDSGSVKVVLGDGNHRSLGAWETGEKVSVQIKGLLPQGLRPIPLRAVRRQYGDLFRR